MKVLSPSPFLVGLAHWRFDAREDAVVVTIKGSWSLVHEGQAEPLEEPLPLRGDEFAGDDPLTDECLHGSDVVPAKSGVDLLLHAVAQSPHGTPQTASFSVGDVILSLRIAPGQVGARVKGFGPVSPFSTSRTTKWPAVTQAWLDKGWPWAPEELDYGFFNAANPGLQFEGPLRGDEVIRCENLHPEHHRFKCAMPAVRVRGFVVDQHGGIERFREVPLALDTLSVDMVAGTLALVWRGHLPSQSRDLEEITYLYIVSDSLDAPRLQIDQQRRIFELQRSDADVAKRSPDVIGAGANDNEPAPRRAPIPRPKKPATGPLPDDLKAQILRMGTPVAAIAAVEAGNTDLALEIFRKTFKLPQPDLDALMAEQHAKAKAAHLGAGGDPSAFDPPPPKAPAAGAPATASVPWSRERVAAAVIAKVSLAEADLTGLDLSEMDLRGMNFSGALLAEAKLTGSKLDAATFDAANLSGADGKGASFEGATFVEADLTGLKAEGANFSRAEMAGALLDDAVLPRARFDGAVLSKSSLRRAQLDHATFVKADLRGSMLSGASIGGVNFSEGNLDEAIAEGVIGDDVNFRKASLLKFRAGEKSKLHRAKLDGCQAAGSRWMHSDLTAADFRRANLVGADLSRTILTEAQLSGADLERADLTKAKLVRANLSGGDLAQAQLEEADLRNANLSGANLYQANLFLAKLEGATMEGAVTSGTLLRTS